MAIGFDGTDDSIELVPTSGIPTDYPFSIVAWYRTPTTTFSVAEPIAVISSADGKPTYALQIGATGLVSARTSNQFGNSVVGTVSGTVASDTWTHCAAVFSASNSRVAYRNGTAGTANTTSIAFITADRVILGRRITEASYAPGTIAEVAFYNVALSAADINALAKGVKPTLVRPRDLLYYFPLVRGTRELRMGETPTVVGTTVEVHPRRIA